MAYGFWKSTLVEVRCDAVRSYVAAFLEVNLNGKPMDRLLTGGSSDYPDAEVTAQTQSPCGGTQNKLQQ